MIFQTAGLSKLNEMYIGIFSSKEIVLNFLFPLVMLLLFGFIYFKKYKKNKRLKAENANLKSEIYKFQNSISDKNIQIKEIHHRIKNNLQLISSLLNIQGRDISGGYSDFLEKGQSRIFSISLLHQKLYETDQENRVNFQDYAQSLVDSIFEVYVVNDSIRFEVDAHDIFLDVDTSVPLGLIITELVCNAAKHAFANRNEGLISVSLICKNGVNYELIVQDNGIGFPEIFIPEKRLGLELVSLLVLQIKAELKRTVQSGTLYSIRFNKIKSI